MEGVDWVLLSGCYASSPWAMESCGREEQAGPEDQRRSYPSKELLSLVTAQLPDPVLVEQGQTLMELLKTNWNTGNCSPRN
ncbi:unnamed protein product [Coregonus sp. 'balchen']|nr:unnamed protein product [Coregonus sp. 'balchen']